MLEDSPNRPLVEQYFAEAELRGHKLISAYYRLKEAHEEGYVTLTWDDLAYIGICLDYHPAWAMFKGRELMLPEGDFLD
jgi:hypothetical protein